MTRIGPRGAARCFDVERAVCAWLVCATAQDVADHLGISTTTARKYLNRLVDDGVLIARTSTGHNSDTGREVTVVQYSPAPKPS